jgi:hypothetical protein
VELADIARVRGMAAEGKEEADNVFFLHRVVRSPLYLQWPDPGGGDASADAYGDHARVWDACAADASADVDGDAVDVGGDACGDAFHQLPSLCWVL